MAKFEEWVSKPEHIEVIKVTRKNVEKLAKKLVNGVVDISYVDGKLSSMRIDHIGSQNIRVESGDYLVFKKDGNIYRMTKSELKKKYSRA